MCCYARGCRCEKCKRYNAEKNARYVARRKQRQPGWVPGVLSEGASPSAKSSLRVALESGALAALKHALLETVTVDEAGCWKWPRTSEYGYAFMGANERLHRLVLEVKCGAPLGRQTAHHVCGTRSCVNPDHLQPVTHIENNAEMLQRRTYLARIAELEQVVAALSPDHPVLRTVPVL